MDHSFGHSSSTWSVLWLPRRRHADTVKSRAKGLQTWKNTQEHRFIAECIEGVTAVKTVKLHPTDKLRLTEEVHLLLGLSDAAFRYFHIESQNIKTNNLKGGIYKDSLEKKKSCPAISQTKTQGAYRRDLQTATDNKPAVTVSDPSLTDNHNVVFSVWGFSQQSSKQASTAPPTNHYSWSQTVGRGSSPTSNPKRLLVQITGLSSPGKAPICFKSSTMDDYPPAASMISTVMKCLEQLVMNHIKTCSPTNLDLLQFPYRANRSAIILTSDCYFNLATATQLKAVDAGCRSMHVPKDLGLFKERWQTVRAGSVAYMTTTVSTGSPRGCVWPLYCLRCWLLY